MSDRDRIPDDVLDAVQEWLDRNDPLSRAEFDRRQSAFLRDVGETTTHPDWGSNKHFRTVTAAEVGGFAAEADVALVELDDQVRYADVHGFPSGSGWVPVLICLGGPLEDAAERMHQLYHDVDATSACDHCAVTDGGEDIRTLVQRFVENHPDADRWEVLGQMGLDPGHQDVVDDVLEEIAGDDEPYVAIARTESDDEYDGINYNKCCANPYCHEPRTNPHQDSLCEKHHPGDPSGPSGQRELQDLDPDDDDDDLERRDDDQDDPDDEERSEPRPDEPVEGSEDDVDDEVRVAEAVAGAGEPEDVDVVDLDLVGIDEDELTAADFMGGAESPLAGNRVPDPTPSSTSDVEYARTVSALPIEQLDALAPTERKRAARKRGLEWPTTDEAREQLFDAIGQVMRHEDDKVVDAPTSLGKSHTVAATRWDAYDHLTGDRPVVHLSQTRDARDEAIEAAEAEGGEYFVLRSRDEACPVAAGDHDPDQDDPDNDRQTITLDGEPASEWIDTMCNNQSGRGLPFSAVHRHLEDHNDQGIPLPCCTEHAECPAISQWERWRDGEWPLTLATHNFAHVPGIRTQTNVVVDEEPGFEAELSTDRVRRAVAAYLQEIDAPIRTWEAFIQSSRYDGYGDDAANEQAALEDALDEEPDREWYFRDPDAHTLAPALARAIFHAEARENDRRVGKTPYEPPRLDRNARDDDGWNREWITVVLDESNDVQTVRTVPDLSQARSVIGLDAHPAAPVWQANTVPWIQTSSVLDPTDRQLWRRYERGLRVVQVGDATRPLASGEYFDANGTRSVVDHLRSAYGHDFQTALTASSVEDDLEAIMRDAGVPEPELMHFGEEKSRNDFANERVGFVNGCIDPGDQYVVDLLAELDLEAHPERSDSECDHCQGEGCPRCDGTGHKRAHGRAFSGPDADSAQEILAAVRENHTAQAAGRYARSPDDPDSTATVFVRTDATPPGFADVQVPGAEWVYTSKQQAIVEALRDHPGSATVQDIASEVDASSRTIQRTLKRLVEHDVVQALERTGPNGATLYRDDGTPHAGVADLTDEDGDVSTTPVWGSHTWTVAITEPNTPSRTESAKREESGGEWDWRASQGSGIPPDNG